MAINRAYPNVEITIDSTKYELVSKSHVYDIAVSIVGERDGSNVRRWEVTAQRSLIQQQAVGKSL